MARKTSAFHEVGLEGEVVIIEAKVRSGRRVVTEDDVHLEGTTSSVEIKPFVSGFRLAQVAALVVFVGLLVPRIHVAAIPPQAISFQTNPRLDQRATLKRQADICKRWAGQSAVVNGTLYYYGGRSTSSADQTTDTWNDNFSALDLTRSWQISTPAMTSLATPSGPPAVSLGYLWSSNDALYLYGGQFSDTPVVSPVPFSLWSYDIGSKSWSERRNQTFEDGSPVQRAAEGAGISVPSLGKGYYFGGHLDGYTTTGWSQSIPRVYLQTLLEYTMSTGEYRNISADSAGFPERADGSLVYIPGYGASGIILGLAGGTNQTFTQMNVIDVYDIAESRWYKQATSGSTPGIRVNPCTVAATAADGSSTQVYMYGGQNLIPYGEQKQYDDIWVLTIPSFTWMQVNTDNQAVPPARAGHTCNIWNSQMVVVGGYVGQDLTCDSPGIYVFNTSSLTWQNEYFAMGGDTLNRQVSQKDDPNALQGSFGYQVPAAIQSIIGGNEAGGATATIPAQTPTQGPLATGRSPRYTNVPGSSNEKGGVNVGAIVAGVIAGVFFIVALYLAFCAWVYRKQLRLYKRHAALLEDSRHSYADGSHWRSNKREDSTESRVLNRNNPYSQVSGSATAASSTEELMRGQEPSLLGIMLSPRRSLRVVNRD